MKKIILPYLVLLLVWIPLFLSMYSPKLLEHLYAPVTLVFGAFIAGFTTEGGGAVSFPVFTKLLHLDPILCRDFAFAIQSVGMTFASVFILRNRIKIEYKVLIYGAIGGVIGIVLGSLFVVPLMSGKMLKLAFTLFATSFGIVLFFKNFITKGKHFDSLPYFKTSTALTILAIGTVGGVVTSCIGTGIDMLIFSVCAVLFKINEKVLTPTTVIIQASNSIFGFAFHGLIVQDFTPAAFDLWILCVPVVAIFAPLGAYACTKVPRLFIVKFLIFLILIEFFTTIYIIGLNYNTLLVFSLSLVGSMAFYFLLMRMSEGLIRKNSIDKGLI